MTARAAAGMSSSAVKAPLIGPSVASHSFDRPLAFPLIRAANLGSPGASRLQCLAPSALYRPSNSPTRLNFAFSRSSGFPQLGISVWQESARQQRMCVVARGMAAGAGSDLESWINETISKEPVVVYSKTYCPYCMRVKKLLDSLGYDFEVVELDAGGQPGLQDALERVSGQYTVPNVFIGGKHIGGCDDTVTLHSRGELEPLLQAAGASRNW